MNTTNECSFISEFFDDIERWAKNCVNNRHHVKDGVLEKLGKLVMAWWETAGVFYNKEYHSYIKEKCNIKRKYIKKDERDISDKEISDKELRELRDENKKILCGKGYPLGNSPGWLLHALVSAVVMEVVNSKLEGEGGFNYDGPCPRKREQNPALYHIWKRGEEWVRVSFGQKLPSKGPKPDVAICLGYQSDPKENPGKVIAIMELKTSPTNLKGNYEKFAKDVEKLTDTPRERKCIYVANFKAKHYHESKEIEKADEYFLHEFFKEIEKTLEQLKRGKYPTK